jgi:serine/threonine protein kinase
MEAIPSGESSMPFGRYLIRERIAQGGMGEVFFAVAVGADGFEKPVVIKRLLPKFAGRADIVSLLAREAKLMTRLIHPNIVQVIDFGRGQSDDYFLVMELVGGADLGRFCQAQTASEGRVPAPLALFIATQMLRGLAYAHATASADGKRLVHRDISPGNVLLSTFGEVKIADFGVALVASSADQEGHDGWLVGKPAYMAPEQLARGAVDERADIYSVGAVLFQTLTGSQHREGKDADAALASAELSPRARTALAGAASPELVLVVARALAARPEDRYASAREMGRAIEQLVEKGQKLGTADDLAEAVAAAVPHETQRRKAVLLLSTGEQDGLTSGTELRHTGEAAAGEGFTLKIRGDSGRPPPTPRGGDARSPENLATRSRRRLWTLAIAGLSLVALTAGLAARGAYRAPPPAPSPSPVQSSNPPDSPQRGPAEPTEKEPTIASSSISPTKPDPTASPHPAQRPREALKEPVAPATQEVQPTCRGQLHVYATHGWLIAGGPATVQAPGRYDWPCGTYALKATSRVDAHDSRTITVTVREATAGVIDLR